MRVVIGEDEVLLREGLVLLLGRAGFDVVAAVGDADSLVRAAVLHRPDVVVTDIRMPPGGADDGLRAAVALQSRLPRTGVLVLSQHLSRQYALDLLATGGAGVGYLLKQRVAQVERFVDAVRRVGEGGSALDPEVVARLLGRRRRDDPLERLTERERQVLALMAEGRSNRGIAEELVVTEHAVEKHIGSTLGKLGVSPGAGGHRRVLAVLAYLRGAPQQR